PLPGRLRLQGSEARLGCVAQRLEAGPQGRWNLTLSDGSQLEAPRVIVALPARRAAALLGPELSERLNLDPDLARPEAAIVSVWLWSDEPLLPELMVAFGPQGPLPPAFHWGFSNFLDGQWRTCVVTSALDAQASHSAAETEAALAGFLASRGRPWRWTRARVVRERAATPIFAPGSPSRRAQATSLPGLALAGDWTETGLPATIEGAVRSGRLAFECFSFDERFSHD
ncbi:MAG: FAD-dependent oxidoreductase, partial [bacterium]